jgi:uncharacterized membrane protein SpoIIM required for sporulation
VSRQDFVGARRQQWQEFDKVLARLRKHSKQRLQDSELARFPAKFRRVCQDLALARHRNYGLSIAATLNDLALAGYHALHGVRPSPIAEIAAYLVSGFPREVRANGASFALCNLLFFGPFLLLFLAGFVAPEWVLAVVDIESRTQLEASFGGDAIVRDTGSNIQMFAFYVWNNVGIDFRTFAGGIVFGLGTLFLVVSNGITLGASFGYAAHADLLPNFMAFTAGHGSLELMAIVIAAMSGLKLAQGLVAPGRMTRGHALRVRALEGVRLLFGAAVMTTLAAFVEGLWSASPAPNEVKYVVGACGWIAVLVFFALGGRRASV